MGIEDMDELEVRRNGSTLPPALPPDATREEMVGAINILAKAADEQARELQLIRLSIQAIGTNFETFRALIEKALSLKGG